MFDKDILATFKKHLNGIDKTSNEGIDTHTLGKSKKIRKFGEDMKSANEFIGAVQILDIALSKLIAQSQRLLVEGEMNKEEFDSLEGIVTQEMNAIIQQCSFMGTGLFDTTLSVAIHSKVIELEVLNPMPLAKSEGYEGVIAYLEDKRSDVNATLAFVSEQILDKKIFEQDTPDVSYEQGFDAKDFLKMF